MALLMVEAAAVLAMLVLPRLFSPSRGALDTPIQRIPNEVLHQIVALACEGPHAAATAHALLRVSRRFAALTQPFRFQNISVSGPGQLAAVMHNIERMPLARVRWVFLSDRAQSGSRELQGLPMAPHDVALLTQDLTGFLREACRLISRAAPTLETLTVLIYTPFCTQQFYNEILSIAMPALAVLTLRIHRIPEHTHHNLLGSIALPCLTHLHISGKMPSRNVLASVLAIAEKCERLEHLTLSGSVPDFAYFQANYARQEPPAPDALRLPPSVRRVVLQPFLWESHAFRVPPEPNRARPLRAVRPAVGLVWLPPVRAPRHAEWAALGLLGGECALEGASTQSRVFPLDAFACLQ